MSISMRSTPPELPHAQSGSGKGPRKPDTRRRIFYSVAGALALILIGIAAWELFGAYKAHMHQTLLAALRKDPSQIKAAMDSHQITEREAMHLQFENLREGHQSDMDQYFSLKTPVQRAAWMRSYILAEPQRREEMRQTWIAMRGTTRPSAGNLNGPTTRNANNKNPWNNPAYRLARYESMNPVRRAQFIQFHTDMIAAYKSMGMQPPQWGRR